MQKSWLSPSTGEPCTSAQYIAEILITRKARKEKKVLPHKFWNEDPWKKKFKVEMIAVNALLRIYNEVAVIKALESEKGKTIYSIRCPWLDELIEEQIKKQEIVPEVKPELIIETEVKEVAKPFGKKTNISKLRDLDG